VSDAWADVAHEMRMREPGRKRRYAALVMERGCTREDGGEREIKGVASLGARAGGEQVKHPRMAWAGAASWCSTRVLGGLVIRLKRIYNF
jgi:hypothetical protein